MTTKSRKNYTSRDWEDIVRIELTDEIDRLRKLHPAKELLESEEWANFIGEVLAACKAPIEVDSSDTCFLMNGKHYSRAHQNFGGINTWGLGEQRRDLRINVVALDGKTRAKVMKKFTEWRDRTVNTSKGANVIKDLQIKLENYKDLAARFRLGYTGDPADLDGIQNKCRAFLLGEGAAK